MSNVQWGPYKYHENSDVGYWSETTHNDRWTVGPANYGYQNRSDKYSSDHISPTSYYRESVRVNGESPSVAHYRWFNPDGTTLNSDYVSTRWMSGGLPDPAFWGYPDPWFSLVGNLEDKLINSAREGLNKGEFNLGVTVGEARSTVNMFAVKSGQMAHALDQFRRSRGNRSRFGRVTNAIAGAWLEGYYGWGGLARDVFSLYQNLQLKLSSPLLLSNRASGSDGILFEGVSGFRYKSDWKCKMHVQYKYQMSDPYAAQMEAWGLFNPISIAWELVPLSFVVDWFVPIGNTLSALTADAGLTFHSGYVTTVNDVSALYQTVKPDDPHLISYTPGYYDWSIYTMFRRVLTGFQPPRLYANKNPFSTNQAISASALATQTILKLLR